MKKTFLMTALLLCALLLFANSGELVLYEDTDRPGHGQRSEYPIPVVTYDDDEVSITCDSVMPNVLVVVRDEDMQPIYYGVMTISTVPSTFNVNHTFKEKYMIQLYTENRQLYGYFNLY